MRDTWVCPNCRTRYWYDLPTCSLCGSDLTKERFSEGTVVAVTEIQSPPLGHEDVPYWTALVEDEDHRKILVKSDKEVALGQKVEIAPSSINDHLPRLGVAGTGVMGVGLVEHFLSKGYRVFWYGRSSEKLARGEKRVRELLMRHMSVREVDEACSRLDTSNGFLGFADCDLVIEAIVEDADTKKGLLTQLEHYVRPDAVIATNTSGLSLDDLAEALVHPERFGALHFFNPVARMKLVETAVCSKTSQETSEYLDRFAQSLGKVPIRISATPAFAVNRALMPLINEAIRELEEGVASAEDIDNAIMLGLNHPIGPLNLADLIGLDVCERIMDNIADRLDDDTYRPRPLLRALVREGKLGRKTGEGFYQHTSKPLSG